MQKTYTMVSTREGATFIFPTPESNRTIGFAVLGDQLGTPALLTSDDFNSGFNVHWLEHDTDEVAVFNICQRVETIMECQRLVVTAEAKRFKRMLGGNIFGDKLILTIFKPAF